MVTWQSGLDPSRVRHFLEIWTGALFSQLVETLVVLLVIVDRVERTARTITRIISPRRFRWSYLNARNRVSRSENQCTMRARMHDKMARYHISIALCRYAHYMPRRIFRSSRYVPCDYAEVNEVEGEIISRFGYYNWRCRIILRLEKR